MALAARDGVQDNAATGTAESMRAHVPVSPTPAVGNRALARALSDAAASRTLGLASAAGARTLARCAGCGGRCGGTCGHKHREPDEELMASGQKALRRAVTARHA
jgi:hypothetical protein